MLKEDSFKIIENLESIPLNFETQLLSSKYWRGLWENISQEYVISRKFPFKIKKTTKPLFNLYTLKKDKTILQNLIQTRGITDQHICDAYTNSSHLRCIELLREKYKNLSVFKVMCEKEYPEQFYYIDKDVYNKYVSPKIQYSINNDKLFNTHITYTYKEVLVELQIISGTTKETKKYIKKISDIVNFVLHFFNVNEPLYIDIYLNDHKKNLSKKGEILGVDSINSGLTTFYNNNEKKIIIYRKEEVEKLLIHEIIHYYKIDFEHITVPNKFYDHFNINPKYEIIINESYTELFTILINCCINSVKIGGKPKYHLATLFLDYEIQFGLLQIAKYLLHYNFKNSEHFFRAFTNDNLNDNDNDISEWKQDSCVFSYFIAKISLLLNLDKTLYFMLKNIDRNYSISKSDSVKQSYVYLVIESCNDNLKQHIDYMIERLYKYNDQYNDRYNDRYILDTCRMTCVDVV